MKKTKCKIDFKEKDGKIVLTMQGHCDPQHPEKEINHEQELNFPDIDN